MKMDTVERILWSFCIQLGNPRHGKNSSTRNIPTKNPDAGKPSLIFLFTVKDAYATIHASAIKFSSLIDIREP